MAGVYIGVALTITAIMIAAHLIRRSVLRTHARTGIAQLEAFANHPVNRHRKDQP